MFYLIYGWWLDRVLSMLPWCHELRWFPTSLWFQISPSLIPPNWTFSAYILRNVCLLLGRLSAQTGGAVDYVNHINHAFLTANLLNTCYLHVLDAQLCLSVDWTHCCDGSFTVYLIISMFVGVEIKPLIQFILLFCHHLVRVNLFELVWTSLCTVVRNYWSIKKGWSNKI